jgi:hypothetical protein
VPIATCPNGDLAVCDEMNGRIKIVTADGAFVRCSALDLDQPISLAYLPNGDFAVTGIRAGSGVALLMAPDGCPIRPVAEGSAESVCWLPP